MSRRHRRFRDSELRSDIVFRLFSSPPFSLLLALTLVAGCTTGSAVVSDGSAGSEEVPTAVVVQPGAPGEATNVYDSAGDIELVRPDYTPADVRFMQGMIHHHAQALEMAALVPDRSNRRDLLLLAKRIEVAQKDEIRLMQDWLESREEEVPHVDLSTGIVRAGHDGYASMPGMLTGGEMERLRASDGSEFYRLWITFMIRHHEGALGMVADLFSHDGAAQDQDIFRFASEVDIDQRVEIVRMQQMLKNYR